VVLSRRCGCWTPPPVSGCPLGVRVGWIVLVLLLLGPVGWLLFWRSRNRTKAQVQHSKVPVLVMHATCGFRDRRDDE
jgi:hypothetical protein